MNPDIQIGEKLFPHPLGIPQHDWHDDMKKWPPTETPQITVYLVKSKACDLQEMAAHRSLESYNYLISGWVGQVLFHDLNTELCYLKAEVTPSQSMSVGNHTAWVCIQQKDGVIVSAGCSCMAGLGRACSHAGALLWKIDLANRKGFTGQTCTDRTAMWNCGTKRNVEPSLLKDTVFKKVKKVEREIDNINKSSSKQDFGQTYSSKEFLEHLQINGLLGFLNIPGTILKMTASVSINSKPIDTLPNIEVGSLVHNHSNHHLLPFACQPCVKFYQDYVSLLPDKIEKLQQLTLMQSRSDLWVESRKLRITASTASKIPKTERSDPSKFLQRHIYRPFLGNEFTRYGIKFEEHAIKQFCRKTGLHVKKCGTVVSGSDCWLSASPDGLVDNDAVLEVKCPVPGSFSLKKMDLFCENDAIQMDEKGARGYYVQIQLSMHCLQRQLCYFYVWRSDADDILVKIHYDYRFVQNLLLRLRSFYYQHMLPLLANDVHNNKLVISSLYQEFVK